MGQLVHDKRNGFRHEHKGDTSIGAAGSTVAFFGGNGGTKPTAMTARTTTTINTGDAGSDTAITNMRTRINELEDKLKALGLLS